MTREELQVELELMRQERLQYREVASRPLSFAERTGVIPMLCGAAIAAGFLYSVGALGFLF